MTWKSFENRFGQLKSLPRLESRRRRTKGSIVGEEWCQNAAPLRWYTNVFAQSKMILSRAWLHDTVSCAAWNDARKGVYLEPLFKTPCSSCYWGWSKPIMLDYISLMESVPLLWRTVTASPVGIEPLTYNWYLIHNVEKSTFSTGWPPNTPYDCAEARRTQVADATFRDLPRTARLQVRNKPSILVGLSYQGWLPWQWFFFLKLLLFQASPRLCMSLLPDSIHCKSFSPYFSIPWGLNLSLGFLSHILHFLVLGFRSKTKQCRRNVRSPAVTGSSPSLAHITDVSKISPASNFGFLSLQKAISSSRSLWKGW